MCVSIVLLPETSTSGWMERSDLLSMDCHALRHSIGERRLSFVTFGSHCCVFSPL